VELALQLMQRGKQDKSIMNASAALTEEIFGDFLLLSQRAFENGLFESAYHALQSAYHCALVLNEEQHFLTTERLASEQIASIDLYHPENVMSTSSARNRRGGVSFYKILMQQSFHHAQFIRDKEERDRRYAGKQ
jgi:hypothetical protein